MHTSAVFYFTAELYHCVAGLNLFICAPIDKHLDDFPVWFIMNKSSMNIHISVFLVHISHPYFLIYSQSANDGSEGG